MISDSSKHRKKLRKKTSEEKARLENWFSNYNKVSDQPLTDVTQISNGNFPWKDDTQLVDAGNYSMHYILCLSEL